MVVKVKVRDMDDNIESHGGIKRKGVVPYCNYLCSTGFVSNRLNVRVNLRKVSNKLHPSQNNSVQCLSTQASFKFDT